MNAILEIKCLRGGYLPGVDILQDVNLAIEIGETVGIIGLNGSGKSTLGKAIVNLIPIRQGEILYKGVSVMDMPASGLSQQGIVIMQQGGKVFRTMSVWDNLQLAFNTKDCQVMDTLTEFIPLLQRPKSELRYRMADQLSGGERHQLALAMTLAQQPQLVVLDEPSAGLSPKAVDEMYRMLTLAKERLGISTLLIEQNIAKAITFCNRCALLSHGRIMQIFTNQNIEEIERKMFNK
ncbi:MAG: ATP-binding cassette domain-containing protein [Prevotella sp.]|nr:ATP-binding cassette domain-containing protein [Prevotella sp.]